MPILLRKSAPSPSVDELSLHIPQLSRRMSSASMTSMRSNSVPDDSFLRSTSGGGKSEYLSTEREVEEEEEEMESPNCSQERCTNIYPCEDNEKERVSFAMVTNTPSQVNAINFEVSLLRKTYIRTCIARIIRAGQNSVASIRVKRQMKKAKVSSTSRETSPDTTEISH